MLIPSKNFLFCCPCTDEEIKISNLVTYFSVDGKICISLAMCICIIVCVYHKGIQDDWSISLLNFLPVYILCAVQSALKLRKKLLSLPIETFSKFVY